MKIKDSYSLYRKILKATQSQDMKLIRREKSHKPKIDPLPYLKKIRESLSKSIEISEEQEAPQPKTEISLSSIIPLKNLASKLHLNSRCKYLQASNRH